MSTTRKFSVGVASLAAGATVAGMLLLGAGVASAAAPPYEPDPSSVGTLTFYDSSGNVVTGGSTLTAPFAAYAVGSVAPRSTDRQGQLLFANPDSTKDPTLWYKEPVGGYSSYPLTTGPANVVSASQTKPVVLGGSGDQTIDGFEQDSNISTTAGYQNVVQVRLKTANSAGQAGNTYDVADLSINPTTHTWTQVYPVPNVATSTTLTSSANPSIQGSSVTFTATESGTDSTHPAGSVQFVDGTTNLGSPVAVSASGVATYATSALSQGTHSITAVFTPSASGYNGSTSPAVSQKVNPPAAPTTTALSVTQDGKAGDDVNLSANVSPAAAPGTVSFYDNNSATPLNSSPITSTTGTYVYDIPAGLNAGSHSIVAKFTPTDVTQFQASQSAANAFTLQPPATSDCPTANSCNDAQNIQVTIPNGSLSITTPYTASNPLDLGTATLTANNAQYTASGSFSKIEVVDTRSGARGYTVSALSSNLTDGKSNPGSVINSQNVGLTNVTATGTTSTGTITTTQNPAASPAVGPTATGNAGLGGTTAHTVFTNSNGLGTTDVSGTVTINAPTSTEAGLFLGTITFTVA